MKTEQTAVDFYRLNSLELFKDFIKGNINDMEWGYLEDKLFETSKEMEKKQHRSTADIFEFDGFQRCYYHTNQDSLNFDKWYSETYGGNK
jgi:hypothetical protein